MADPQDMVIPLLGEMRGEISELPSHMDFRFGEVGNRLKKMDEPLVTFRHAPGADSLLSKIVTGEFEERLGVLERRLSELETQK